MSIFTSDSHDIIHFWRPWQYSLPTAMTIFTSNSHDIIHIWRPWQYLLPTAMTIFTSDSHDMEFLLSQKYTLHKNLKWDE
jgi:hypothetical protein